MNSQRQRELLDFASYVARNERVSEFRRQLLGNASALAQRMLHGSLPSREDTDILFVHLKTSIGAGKKALAETLQNKHGLIVRHFSILNWVDVLKRKNYLQPDYRVHPLLRLKAGIARYVVEKYQPKVIVLTTEDTLVPFLRYEAARVGAKLVNIAHSLVFPTHNFGMCDYDYYFVYGQSSLDALIANQARYGDTRVALTGALEIGRYNAPLPKLNGRRQITYFSTWVPKRYKTEYKNQFSEIIEFARTRPHWVVVVRLHPLEDGSYWRRRASVFENIRVSDCSESIADAISDSMLTVCSAHSTTVLDAAYLNRVPIILAVPSDAPNYYSCYPELFRLNGESLGDAVDRNLLNFNSQLACIQKLSSQSLARQDECQALICGLLFDLSRGKELDQTYLLAQPERPTWAKNGHLKRSPIK